MHSHKLLRSLILGGVRETSATAWIFAGPSKLIRQKGVDKVLDEFRQAGIGTCFKGERSHVFIYTMFHFLLFFSHRFYFCKECYIV
jgi:hypothetical protein